MNIVHFISQLIIPIFILVIVTYAFFKRVKVYDCFVNGAKEGISVTLRIFPYVLAIFVAVKAFQASGAFHLGQEIFRSIFHIFNLPFEIISISLIKPLSGSAALGVFTDIVKDTGPDSLASRISAVIMGSAETTFYVLAIYLGALGIKKTRYLIPVCVIADFIGIIVAIIMVKLFFYN
ncbi:MAG: spore maturation protein [Thermodesulfobacteriota bacterium]